MFKFSLSFFKGVPELRGQQVCLKYWLSCYCICSYMLHSIKFLQRKRTDSSIINIINEVKLFSFMTHFNISNHESNHLQNIWGLFKEISNFLAAVRPVWYILHWDHSNLNKESSVRPLHLEVRLYCLRNY